MTNGLLAIDKPAGWTSHDVVARLRRLTGQRRVGHSGTLDPSATGVLVVCFGTATRLLEYLVGADKVYQSEFVLGVTTDTDDAEGAVLSRADPSGLTAEQVTGALDAFIGEIDQTPPAVSAVKVGGVRAYALARAGKALALAPRRVTIQRIELISLSLPRLVVRISCGSGVYIRSIARDLGERLGVGGHVRSLRRLAVGEFTIDDAVSLETVEAAALAGTLDELIAPPLRALVGWPVVPLDGASVAAICQGRAILREGEPGLLAAATDAEGRLIAILEAADGQWQPVKVLKQEEGT
ncbi:MAG: tRNA pseudouridine(55) synthase TruB [Dehalococcoidia bacterium]